MSDLVKKDSSPPPSGLSLGKLRSTSTPFQSRVNQAKASQPDASSMPHRICLMLDRSSSMSSPADYTIGSKGNKAKIELLKDAIDNFVNRCNFQNTSIAVETFPASLELALTNINFLITSQTSMLSASGNTPMHQCVVRCLEKIPMTRGIIVSDGEATDWNRYRDLDEEEPRETEGVLSLYKKAGIPIDCVHIGDSTSGEELLRLIAKETGGLYLKFTDVSAFANSFGFLTPGHRAQLTNGSVSAEELGASEVRR